MNKFEKTQMQNSPTNNLKKYQSRPSYFRVILTSNSTSFLGKIRIFCILILILLLIPILSHVYSELRIFEEKIPQISLEEGLNKENLKFFIQNLTGSIVEEVSWKGESISNEKKKLAEKAEIMEESTQKKMQEIEETFTFIKETNEKIKKLKNEHYLEIITLKSLNESFYYHNEEINSEEKTLKSIDEEISQAEIKQIELLTNHALKLSLIENQRNEVKERKGKNHQNMIERQKKIGEVKIDIDIINAEISELVNKIKFQEAQIYNLKEEIRKIEEEFDFLDKTLNDSRIILKKRNLNKDLESVFNDFGIDKNELKKLQMQAKKKIKILIQMKNMKEKKELEAELQLTKENFAIAIKNAIELRKAAFSVQRKDIYHSIEPEYDSSIIKHLQLSEKIDSLKNEVNDIEEKKELGYKELRIKILFREKSQEILSNLEKEEKFEELNNNTEDLNELEKSFKERQEEIKKKTRELSIERIKIEEEIRSKTIQMRKLFYEKRDKIKKLNSIASKIKSSESLLSQAVDRLETQFHEFKLYSKESEEIFSSLLMSIKSAH